MKVHKYVVFRNAHNADDRIEYFQSSFNSEEESYCRQRFLLSRQSILRTYQLIARPMLKNIRTEALAYGPNEELRSEYFQHWPSKRLMRALLYHSHMKRNFRGLNCQGDADWSEYEKILPGEQPIRSQNQRSEKPYFI